MVRSEQIRDCDRLAAPAGSRSRFPTYSNTKAKTTTKTV